MAVFWWISTSSTDPTNSANWQKSDGTTGTLPTTGDVVYIVPIGGLALANIGTANQSSIGLAALNISQAFLGTIGTSAAPGGYWQIGADVLNTGTPALDGSKPQGSGRIKIDLGSGASVVNIYNTGNLSSDIGFEPTRIIGSGITAINVSAGFFGLATNAPGETSLVSVMNVTGGMADMGVGVTWITATSAGSGTLNLASAGTTLTTSVGATANTSGSGLIGTVNAGGITNLNNRVGGVDVTTMNIFNTGVADFSGNPSNSTITTLNLYAGGSLLTDPANPDHVTVTTLHKKNGGRLSLG